MSEGKIKGTIVIEVVKYLRSRKDAARSLVPPALHHYLEGRILSTSWHPEADYLELMRAVIKLRGSADALPGVSPWEASARASNAAYFEGPYKSLVRKGDPGRSLVSSLGPLWRLRHDTGEFEIELQGEKAARLELRDYALVAREACELVQGTLWGLLDYSGAKNIQLTHSRCRARGDSVCEWQASWS
jgi:hypothetical protein